MALFQSSVLKSHLALLDSSEVEKAYKKYQKYFWNTTIQENIKSAKEEQYQATFLNELFVNILGYTLFPSPNPNLTTEFKNQKNARKADGAILKDGLAIGVIELKGTKTKDLESIRRQAFDYKANQKGCVYVVTSNFEKLRFYINDATEFEEFDLFALSQERFQLLYLCLHIDKVLKNVPLKIKEASIVEEEQITKDFYKDYSLFKRELYRDLVKRNARTVKAKLSGATLPENQEDILRLEKNVKLTLFKKSQKLIDRFLFIFFAEDRMLLPSNSTLQILNKWKDDWDFGDERHLYDLFKQYFNYLDLGRKGTEKRSEIYAYNGGLFKPDAILDAVEIDSEMLHKYALKLSNYDFESQVDVNILGHIFENSLNEIESINAEIEGGNFDKQTSKRKKDGVFYTPKYITKYIVENTVGKLCNEKKTTLGFAEEEYFKGRKNRNKSTIEKLITILDTYRDWLLEITICDPACGSGAFLNQALDYLIKEHQYIDELKTKVLGGGFQFPDIENTILENNIYGVDLNEESVEIAKLSLWLRTAQPRRKLNDLSSNIKCGNSLIDSKSVAGDKAFHWETAFSKVFKKGGFDVVIGNPPYVRHELFTEIKPFLDSNYEVYHGQADLYVYFFEKGIDILKNNGLFSIIVANKWLKVSYAEELRNWMLKVQVNEIIDFGDLPVFSDASAYPCIITLENSEVKKDIEVTTVENLNFFSLNDYVLSKKYYVDQIDLTKDSWSLVNKNQANLLKKLNSTKSTLHSYTKGIIRRGIVTGMNEAFVINESTKKRLIQEHQSSSEIIKPFLAGRNINKYSIQFNNTYVIFTRRGIDIDNYPAVKSYLETFRKRLEPKPKDWKGNWQGRKMGTYEWYEIQDSIDYYKEFERGKIIYPNICNEPSFCLDNENFYTNQKCFIIPIEDQALLGVMNSSVFSFLFEMNLPKLRGGYYEPSYVHIKHFPLPLFNDRITEELEESVVNISGLNKNLSNLIKKFVSYISFKFSLLKFSRKLENWHDLDFNNFIKELNKAIKATNNQRAKDAVINLGEAGKETTPYEVILPLSKKDEFEWIELFEENKKKAEELQAQINQTEKEIDAMVYELYGLTEEEIKIVENS
ncbi:Eco57I restriction-modification methylase domain-containing protein [Zobellia uliginosa]|uniref:Eco57I restriction-modification methylase domain-containing protein n=1 Tax=Zobellia uliginosa TaxID=143224 RepID=UPI001C07526D|nr:TaqI-like C-terminal specificity domain-containing protein [Zobellia uliginosa]MBU2947374.1 Eco57I restriction-modification methylase domain-containing protein [Zobellia uliginosa]